MNQNLKSSLTKGLMTGYAGGKIENVTRGGFVGKTSHVELPGNFIYHDEWFGNHSGGGQELIQVGNELFTRFYAGGTPDEQTLSSLNISSNDVSTYLKEKITQLSESTRLTNNLVSKPDGEWHYTYKITGNFPETHVTTSLETITYKGTIVHLHAFIMCPIQ